MADKTIGELARATEVQDDSLLVMEQQGTAKSVTGALVKQYAVAAAKEQAETAKGYAEEGKTYRDAAAESAKDAADVALHPPILKDGDDHWWTWSVQENDYVRSELDAGVSVEIAETVTGEPGSTASVKNIGTNTDPRLKFTIPEGIKGDRGDAATINVESVETGDPGSDVIIENTGTENDAKLKFTIPRGDKGETGEQGIQGDPGFSPTVEVSKVDKTTTITITDEEGQHIATILDGEDGAGQVSSVNGKTGEVNLSAEDVDAYTKSETDDLLKNVKVEVDETPTEGSQNPVSSGGVYEAVQGAASRSWEITVSAEGWTEGTDSFAGIDAKWQQTVDAVGVTEDTVLSIDRSSGFVSGDYSAASAVQWYIRPGADTVTVWAPEQTTGDFTVRLTEVR